MRRILSILLVGTVFTSFAPAEGARRADRACLKMKCERYYDVNADNINVKAITVNVAGQTVSVGEADWQENLLVTPNESALALDQVQFGLCKSYNASRRDASACNEARARYDQALLDLAVFATGKQIQPWFQDADLDGYGDPGVITRAFNQPNGSVSQPGDCDDKAGSVHPGATETCNGVDDDCDRAVDEEATGMQRFYRDADGDGAGTGCSAQTACAQPQGYVANTTDPDDGNAGVSAYSGGLTLFEHADFGGRTKVFKEGEHPDLRSSSLHDGASALQVSPGYKVVVCEDINFAGSCDTFTSAQNRLDRCCTGVGNDTISSARITRICPAQ